jgi:formate hydrogenlyase subunit 6/NADH:ubiquinone oxidoreductase subunit I
MGESFNPSGWEKLLSKGETVCLYCRKRQPDSSWPCLGHLDVRLLLALVYSANKQDRTVMIDEARCATCNPQVFSHLNQVIEQTNFILQAAGKTPLKRGFIPPQEAQAKGISRRQFFSQLFVSAVTTVQEVVSPELPAFQRIPRSEWFDQYVKPHMDRKQAMTQSEFKTVVIHSSCDGCGMCAGICHSRALVATVEGNGITLQHDPLTCVNCGVCVVHCPHHALKLENANTLLQKQVAAIELPVCRDCGKHFQPVGGFSVCMDCMIKAKTQSVW